MIPVEHAQGSGTHVEVSHVNEPSPGGSTSIKAVVIINLLLGMFAT